MKCAILLALVAFASATPLTGWGGVGNYPTRGVWGDQGHLNEVSHQVASQVTQGAIHDQLAHTFEAIKSLQGQSQQYPGNWAGMGGPHGQVVQQSAPGISAEAINQLQEDMQYQQGQFASVGAGHSQGSAVNQLYDTVQAGVEAQVTAGHIHYVKGTQGVNIPVVSGLHTNVFQSKVQKLVDQYNQQEIDNKITYHHHRAQQLHLQQEFINQQKQQIEAQLSVVQHQGAPGDVQHLNQVYQNLKMQEHSLIQGELAHHLAILHLQQALVQKEHQVLQDTASEHMQEQVVQGTYHPFGPSV